MRLLPVAIVVTTSLSLTSFVWAAQQPVRNLQVTLRGKRYDIDQDVTTVRDLQDRVKEASGVALDQSVLFQGKRLEPTDILSDVGVSNGAQLNMVPSTMSSKAKTKKSTTTTTTKSTSSSSDTTDPMKEYLKQSGVDTDKLDELFKGMGDTDKLDELVKGMGDTDKLDELFKGMGGGAGAGGEGMPSMQESMEMMSNMMNSPIFEEIMTDPEKLEQSRQLILGNPTLKSMMGAMPGMEELLNDPEAWKEAMQAAVSMYKNIDKDEMMKTMMGGAPGAGTGPGLFDGTLDQSAAAAALDELDDEDD